MSAIPSNINKCILKINGAKTDYVEGSYTSTTMFTIVKLENVKLTKEDFQKIESLENKGN